MALSHPAGATATSGRTSVVTRIFISTRPSGATMATRSPSRTPALRAASGWSRTSGSGILSRTLATWRNWELMYARVRAPVTRSSG